MSSFVRGSATALAAVVLGLASMARAQEIIYGHNALTRTRMDPIISPGELAGHVHVFAGTNAIDSHMTYESATAADCSTGQLGADKSGYWIPQLYYKWRNGTYTAISGDGIVTYWFLDRGVDRTKGERPVVVPDDFRIVAGDMNRDFLDKTIPSHNAVSFQCFGKGYDYRLNTLPVDAECENIRPQIFFPSCWNQVDSYLPDNSHVTYPVGAPGDYENGKCPPGFVKIPALFMETYYTNLKGKLGPDYEWYPGSLVFSNGDNHGLSLHADWQNGFPKGLLVEVFDQCPDLFGNPSACPVLAKYDVPDAGNRDCTMKGQIANEPIGLQTPLAKLPGNNPEFNSSKAGNNLKRLDPGYVETATLISYDGTSGGACKSQKCLNYTGPRAAPAPGTAPPVTAPKPSGSTASKPSGSTSLKPSGAVSSSLVAPAASAPASSSSAAMSSVLPIPAGGGALNAEPVKSSLGMPASATKPATVCSKRKRSESKRRLPGGY